MDTTLISYFLPEGILEYFTATSITEDEGHLTVHLEEKASYPREYSEDVLKSKGFLDAITVQDFPVRGKACYLKVKRRRWLNETTGEIVSRDWALVASGTRMTKEFAAFLKGISR